MTLKENSWIKSLLKQKNSFERHVDENGRMLKPKTAKIHFVAISTLCVLKKTFAHSYILYYRFLNRHKRYTPWLLFLSSRLRCRLHHTVGETLTLLCHRTASQSKNTTLRILFALCH